MAMVSPRELFGRAGTATLDVLQWRCIRRLRGLCVSVPVDTQHVVIGAVDHRDGVASFDGPRLDRCALVVDRFCAFSVDVERGVV